MNKTLSWTFRPLGAVPGAINMDRVPWKIQAAQVPLERLRVKKSGCCERGSVVSAVLACIDGRCLRKINVANGVTLF